MKHDVFISHSKFDAEVALAIATALEHAGVTCWMASRDIVPSENWGAAIVEAIGSSELFVLVFSSKSNVSPQVLREVERAVHHEVPIIPYRIENIEPSSELEYYLSVPHWMNAWTPNQDRHLAELVRVAKRILKRPESVPVMPVVTPPIAAVSPPVTVNAADFHPCPFCAEPIRVAAKLCRYCGRDVVSFEPPHTKQDHLEASTGTSTGTGTDSPGESPAWENQEQIEIEPRPEVPEPIAAGGVRHSAVEESFSQVRNEAQLHFEPLVGLTPLALLIGWVGALSLLQSTPDLAREYSPYQVIRNHSMVALYLGPIMTLAAALLCAYPRVGAFSRLSIRVIAIAWAFVMITGLVLWTRIPAGVGDEELFPLLAQKYLMLINVPLSTIAFVAAYLLYRLKRLRPPNAKSLGRRMLVVIALFGVCYLSIRGVYFHVLRVDPGTYGRWFATTFVFRQVL